MSGPRLSADLLLCPIQKPDTDLLFQILNLPRERRLRGVQLSGGFCEAKRLRHGDEVAQMTKFHRAKTSRVNRLDTLMQKKNCRL